jgi:hypothetical protein
MDDMVLAAMAKWPHVPHCYGWLGLDARGNWYMRDDQAQACGSFASGLPGAKGSLLRHDKLIAFIERNYAADERGCWYFQNGPQRVYVELECTPWVWRIAPDATLHTHTGQEASYRASWLDERGWLYLEADLGGAAAFGLVHSMDMALAAAQVEAGAWAPGAADSQNLAQRHGYMRSPQALKMAG